MKIRKPIIAFLILLFLSLTMAVITFFFNFVQSQENADYRNNLIAQNAVESLKVLEKDINQVYDSTKQKTIAGVNLTVSILKRLSKRELSSSLHSFEDGIVVQIKGEEVLYPQDYSWRFDNLNAEYLQKEPTLQFQFMRNGETGEEQYTAVTARKIMDDYWYIDWLSKAEYWEMLENQHEIFSIIKDLQEAFDGYIFLFDTQTPDLDITYAPPAYQDVSTAADIGLTKEMIQNKTSGLWARVPQLFCALYKPAPVPDTDVGSHPDQFNECCHKHREQHRLDPSSGPDHRHGCDNVALLDPDLCSGS